MKIMGVYQKIEKERDKKMSKIIDLKDRGLVTVVYPDDLLAGVAGVVKSWKVFLHPSKRK